MHPSEIGCEHYDECSDSILVGNMWPAEWLSTFQERSCSME